MAFVIISSNYSKHRKSWKLPCSIVLSSFCLCIYNLFAKVSSKSAILMLLVILLDVDVVHVHVDDDGYNDDVDDEDASIRQGRSADLTVESTCGRLTTRRCGR